MVILAMTVTNSISTFHPIPGTTRSIAQGQTSFVAASIRRWSAPRDEQQKKPPGWEALACSSGACLGPDPPNRQSLLKTEKLDQQNND